MYILSYSTNIHDSEMHYFLDPEIKYFSVVLCLKVKNCQGALR
jgi:hypothetical protein